MKTSRKRKLSVTILLVLILLVIAAFSIKDWNFLSGKNRLYMIVDNVEGLRAKDAIVMKGMNVGQVKDISFLEDGSARIIVLMKVDKKIKIPVGSLAKISKIDLLGSRVVEILPHSSDIYLNDRDTLIFCKRSGLMQEESVEPLRQKTEEMLESFDTLVQMTELLAEYNTGLLEAVETNNNVNDVVYRIQIMTSYRDISLDDKRFEGLDDIWKYFHNGVYKYTTGLTTNYDKALSLKSNLPDGYSEAFIVAFKDGERISIQKK